MKPESIRKFDGPLPAAWEHAKKTLEPVAVVVGISALIALVLAIVAPSSTS